MVRFFFGKPIGERNLLGVFFANVNGFTDDGTFTAAGLYVYIVYMFLG